MNELYTINLTKIDGTKQSMQDFQGKLLLIVNIASKCGFKGQLNELQELYIKYKQRGLEILAFPCNQFLQQEPLSNSELESLLHNRYQITFSIYSKTEVIGDNANELYKYLRKNHTKKTILPIIPWNFTKFLISKDGKILQRFNPTTSFKNITKIIEKNL